MLDFLLLLIFIVICVGLYYILNAPVRARRREIERLQSRVGMRPAQSGDLSLRRKVVGESGILSLLAKPLPHFERLGHKLQRVGYNGSPKQYLLRRILWILGLTLILGLLLKKSFMLAFCIGVLLGGWLPIKILNIKVGKQNKAFLRLFPEAIDLIVRGLRSGLPVSESIMLVSTEVAQPVGGIFTTVSQTMKLGVPLERALLETGRKLDLAEFNFFTTSITLQRETGGNLSEILNNLSEVLRGRYIMSLKIKAMSSEARASAMIIGALPFIVILAVSVLSPGYLRPLIDDPRGNVAAITAACMMGFGLWIMNRMTKFEI